MLYEIRVSFPEKGAQVNSCLMDSCLWVATRTQLSMRSNYAQEAACRCLLPCGARWWCWWWWSSSAFSSSSSIPGLYVPELWRQFMRTLVNRLHGLNIANLRTGLNPRSKTNKTWRCLVVVWHQEATWKSFPKLGHAEGAWSTKHFMKPFLETIKVMLGPRSSRNSTWSLICIAWEISSGCIFETCTTSDARRRSAASDGAWNWTESSLHIFRRLDTPHPYVVVFFWYPNFGSPLNPQQMDIFQMCLTLAFTPKVLGCFDSWANHSICKPAGLSPPQHGKV